MENSNCSRVTCLILRIITFVFLIISFFLIVTNSQTVHVPTDDYGTVQTFKLRFKDAYAYRYMLATTIIGIVLNLVQIAFSIFNVVKSVDGTILFDFFGDKFLSYFLATGAAAGFGFSVDQGRDGEDEVFKEFFDKAYASSSLLLFAFLCAAVVSILSSFALPKRAA